MTTFALASPGRYAGEVPGSPPDCLMIEDELSSESKLLFNPLE